MLFPSVPVTPMTQRAEEGWPWKAAAILPHRLAGLGDPQVGYVGRITSQDRFVKDGDGSPTNCHFYVGAAVRVYAGQGAEEIPLSDLARIVLNAGNDAVRKAAGFEDFDRREKG